MCRRELTHIPGCRNVAQGWGCVWVDADGPWGVVGCGFATAKSGGKMFSQDEGERKIINLSFQPMRVYGLGMRNKQSSPMAACNRNRTQECVPAATSVSTPQKGCLPSAAAGTNATAMPLVKMLLGMPDTVTMDPPLTSSLALVRKRTSMGKKFIAVCGSESTDVRSMEGAGEGSGVVGIGVRSDMDVGRIREQFLVLSVCGQRGGV